MLTCAFTGHRIIEPEHREIIADLVYNAINYAYDLGCRRFVTGGALGFDTEAARQVIRFCIGHPDASLTVFVPYIDQAAAWSPAQREMYDFILASASEIRYISESYDPDCLRRRNLAMVEACDILIAYANRPRSGTAQTVRMAKERGKEIYNIYRAKT